MQSTNAPDTGKVIGRIKWDNIFTVNIFFLNPFPNNTNNVYCSLQKITLHILPGLIWE
jgi:hypothetical protein